jgi:predicted aspartyl protease
MGLGPRERWADQDGRWILVTLIGSVDQWQRPLLRLEQPDGWDGFVALIDSGFNGHLMLHEADMAYLGFKPVRGNTEVKVASGETVNVKLAEATILWVDEKPLRVRVFVVPAPLPIRRPDDPTVLLGTKLLHPHRLVVDFAANRVELASNDME